MRGRGLGQGAGAWASPDPFIKCWDVIHSEHHLLKRMSALGASGFCDCPWGLTARAALRRGVLFTRSWGPEQEAQGHQRAGSHHCAWEAGERLQGRQLGQVPTHPATRPQPAQRCGYQRAQGPPQRASAALPSEGAQGAL